MKSEAEAVLADAQENGLIRVVPVRPKKRGSFHSFEYVIPEEYWPSSRKCQDFICAIDDLIQNGVELIQAGRSMSTRNYFCGPNGEYLSARPQRLPRSALVAYARRKPQSPLGPGTARGGADDGFQPWKNFNNYQRDGSV